MAAEVLNVAKRETRGKLNAKRMRLAGQIPAVLYGHQKDTVSLSVKADELDAAIRHRAHLVELKGAVSDSALLKDIQWDAFGNRVLHLDLTRVDADEAVSVTLEVELRGEAPGTHHGGVIDQQLRDVEIECPANAIPEKLTLSINELEVGDSMTASQLELPKGATLLSDASSVIVACVEQTILADEEEEAALEATGAEPEVIGGRKPGEAEEAES